MSDFWHKLGCCVVEKPPPVSNHGLASLGWAEVLGQRGLTAFVHLQKKRRRRIDRSMIGEPMNFVHLTHIGSGDMAAGEGLPMVPYPSARRGHWAHGWELGVSVGVLELMVGCGVSVLGCWSLWLGAGCQC